MFLKKSTARGRHYYNLATTYIENGKRHLKILQKLGRLTDEEAEAIREWLRSMPRKGEPFVSLNLDDLDKGPTYVHGQVALMYCLMKRLKIDSLLFSSFAGYRNQQALAQLSQILVLGRYDKPSSDLSLAERYGSWSIKFLNGRPKIYVNQLYRTLSKLYEQKDRIELELWQRIGSHLTETNDAHPFFKDITSSYFEGDGCPKAALGFSRDHRRDCKQINWGLTLTAEGVPITLEVYPGNTVDKTTVLDTCRRLRDVFHIYDGILVGDRGMMSEENVLGIQEMGYHHIITETVKNVQEIVQEAWSGTPAALGDEALLGEVRKNVDGTSERWVVMMNPKMAKRVKKEREARIKKGYEIIERVHSTIASGRLKDPKKIVRRVMKNLLKKGMDKYFDIGSISYSPAEGLSCPLKDGLGRYDGIWVIATDLDWKPERLVATYRDLWKIESAFDVIKNVIEVRPIGHFKDDRVEGHLFVCVLAYYLERLVELAVREKGMNLTGKEAIAAFDLVTLDQISIGSMTRWKITELTPVQRRILKALNISERSYREIEQRLF
jgi:transposase